MIRNQCLRNIYITKLNFLSFIRKSINALVELPRQTITHDSFFIFPCSKKSLTPWANKTELVKSKSSDKIYLYQTIIIMRTWAFENSTST